MTIEKVISNFSNEKYRTVEQRAARCGAHPNWIKEFQAEVDRQKTVAIMGD